MKVKRINEISKLLINGIEEKGGASVNVELKSPTHGFMTSFKGAEVILNHWNDVDVVEFVAKNYELGSRRKHYFGAWEGEGKLYLDISYNFQSEKAAINYGNAQNQISIFDVENKKVIGL